MQLRTLFLFFSSISIDIHIANAWSFTSGRRPTDVVLWHGISLRQTTHGNRRDGSIRMANGNGEPFLIKLDQFLKRADIVASGGEAKVLIKDEGVLVNGMVEIRRGRKLRAGDVVTVDEAGSFDVERLLAGEEASVVPPLFVAEETIEDKLDYRSTDDEDPEYFLDDLAMNVDLDDDGGEDYEETDDLVDKREAIICLEDTREEESEAKSGRELGDEKTEQRAKATRQIIARGETKGGIAVKLRRAKSRDLHKIGQVSWGEQCTGLPKGKDNNYDEAANWVVAELERGFGGVVGLLRAATTMENEVEISHLTVAPSSRQRGIAGALVDYVIKSVSFQGEIEGDACDGDEAKTTRIWAVLPKYQNSKAKSTMEAFFTTRGVAIRQKF